MRNAVNCLWSAKLTIQLLMEKLNILESKLKKPPLIIVSAGAKYLNLYMKWGEQKSEIHI